jgi:putative transposase
MPPFLQRRSDTPSVIKLAQPGAFTDSLIEVLCSGARALLTQAVEAEVAEFLAKHAGLKTETGQRRVVAP